MEVTLKVTGTVWVMPLATIVMAPVNVPAARPVILAETVRVAGAVPVAGETVSQVAPLTVAVNVAAGVALSVKLCEAGDAPPSVAENESAAGLTVNVDEEFTVKVTGTVVVRPFPVTVMVPVKVPADSPVTLEDTVIVAGVVPVDGETVSQGAPLTLAEKMALGLALTDRLCEPGDAPPAVAENESVPGLTFNVDEVELTVKVTGTVRVMPLPVTRMFPV